MRAVALAALLVSLLQTQTAPLRIVVLEGEAAVNIIQQKTAVRPLIEVRDRNNVPIAGATITFTIGGGQPAAFAGGVHTLTVTTNAAGQAAASGFNVLGPGAVQVQVQAAYQGQIATAAISQTNFATAAAASQAGATQAATGGAAGGGGGISATTIAIIGGAVAGGAVAATQVAGGGGDAEKYSTTFSGPMAVSFSNSSGTCVQQRAVTGTLEIVFDEAKDRASYSVNAPTASSNANGVCPQGGLNPGVGGEAAIASRASPSFTATHAGIGGAVLLDTATVEFTGTQSGDTITGTLTYTETLSGFASGGGTVSFPVTLRK